MNTIRLYLENMFYGLAETAEVKRAKEELYQMMEDRYQDLVNQGKTDNEAVGQVIAEFGNLDELADDLDIRDSYEATLQDQEYLQEGLPSVYLADDTAEQYLLSQKKLSRSVGLGVFLIIISVIPLILFGAYGEYYYTEVANTFYLLPTILFFIGVALGVSLFIYRGITTEKFDYVDETYIILSEKKKQELEAAYNRETKSFALQIAGGFIAIFVGIIMIFIFGILGDPNTFYQSLGVALFLVLVALAVYLFIQAGIRRSALEKLLNLGDYSAKNKEADYNTGPWVGAYWSLMVVIYLVWSFKSGGWHYTWLVWPVAGFIYALITGRAK